MKLHDTYWERTIEDTSIRRTGVQKTGTTYHFLQAKKIDRLTSYYSYDSFSKKRGITSFGFVNETDFIGDIELGLLKPSVKERFDEQNLEHEMSKHLS